MAAFSESIVAYFGGDTSGLEKAAIKAEGVVGSFQSALNKVGITLGTAAVIGFFKGVTDNVSRIDDLSKALNLSTDAVQTFEYALEKSGGRAQDIQTLFQQVNRSLDELASGNEKTAESFRKLGLAQEDLAGIPLEQALEKIAAGYVANKNEAGAYSAVIDIVGAKSARLMGTLEDLGTNGFGKLKKDAEDAGILISSDTVARIDELGDRLTGLKKVLIGAGAEVLAFLSKSTDGLGAFAAAIVNDFTGIETAFEALQPAKKAEAAANAIEAATNKLKGTHATLKDFALFNEAEAKREIERLDAQGKAREKINSLLNLANTYLAEAAKYGENTKEQLDYVTKANDLILQVDKERLKIAENRREWMAKEWAAMETAEKKQTEEMKTQAELAAKIAAEKQKQLKAAQQLAALESRDYLGQFVTGLFNADSRLNKSQIQNASDAELQEAKRRLQAQIAAIDAAPLNAATAASGRFGAKLAKVPITADIGAISTELALRESIRSNYSLGGYDYAIKQFQGNPLVFDNLLQQFTGNRTETQASLQEIKKISQTLDSVFKKR